MDRRQFLAGLSPLLMATAAGCSDGGPANGSPTETPGRSPTTPSSPDDGAGSSENTLDADTTAISEPTIIDDPGTYALTGDLTSSETALEIIANDVSIDGRGQTIRGDDPGRNQHGIRVTGDDVTVTNLEVRGWSEDGAGILFEGVSGGEVSNVTGVENFHGIRLAAATDVIVRANTLGQNEEFGLLVDASERNVVEENTVTGNVESGILLWEAGQNRVAGNTLRENELRNNLGGIHLDGERKGSHGNEVASNELLENGDTAIILIGSDDNEVSDNRMESNARHGVFLEGASNNSIANNTAIQNAISGVDLAFSSDQNTITGNTLDDNDGHGIWLLDSHDNTITDNSTTGNDQIGIILADASRNSIASNTVNDNRQGGIDLIGESEYTELVGSHGNEIRGNEVRANEGQEGSGIRLLHSNDNTISENTVAETADHGINLFDTVGNELVGNSVTGNAANGIHFEVNAENVVVRSNVVENNANGVAVGMETTAGVTINGNNLVGNAEYGVVVADMHIDEIPAESPDIQNVDATRNWWGDETGPTHPEQNPSGQGDSVSDNVDFEPWLEEPQ